MSIPVFFFKCTFNVFILGTLRALNKRLSNYYIGLTSLQNPHLCGGEAERGCAADCPETVHTKLDGTLTLCGYTRDCLVFKNSCKELCKHFLFMA